MKIKIKHLPYFLVVFLSLQSCFVRKQNQGTVLPKNSSMEIDFTTQRGVVILPVFFEDKLKFFLFDNGDDLTTINRETLKGKITKVSTATGETTKLGQEKIGLLKIGNFEFRNLNARNQNLNFIEKDVPNLGGLIGQSIISKANWIIDFSKNKMTISTEPIKNDGFQQIKIKNIREPEINFTYAGETYTAFIDLGSSTALSVTEDSPLAQAFQKEFNFKDNTREVASAGGLTIINEKVGNVSNLKIGSIQFDNIQTSIRKNSSQKIRIGAAFFQNKKLIINNSNGSYDIRNG